MMKEILYAEDQLIDAKFITVTQYYFTDVEFRNASRRICDYHTYHINVLRRLLVPQGAMFLVRAEE